MKNLSKYKSSNWFLVLLLVVIVTYKLTDRYTVDFSTELIVLVVLSIPLSLYLFMVDYMALNREQGVFIKKTLFGNKEIEVENISEIYEEGRYGFMPLIKDFVIVYHGKSGEEQIRINRQLYEHNINRLIKDLIDANPQIKYDKLEVLKKHKSFSLDNSGEVIDRTK